MWHACWVNLVWPVVLFDLDGTLANSIDLIVDSYDRAFMEVTGQGVARERALAWIGQTLPQTFSREDPANAKALEVAYRAYNNAHFDRIIAFPGVANMLRALRDAHAITGVVTSKGRDAADASLAQLGLGGLIEVLCCREDTDAHKPDPQPLLAALAKVDATPADAAYVGDAVWDIMAAKAAGMASIAVTWGAGLREELAALSPDALVDTAEELSDVLMPEDPVFTYKVTKDQRVFISWHGRQVATLTGQRAARFMDDADGADESSLQLLMARNTGNFKRGNELH